VTPKISSTQRSRATWSKATITSRARHDRHTAGRISRRIDIPVRAATHPRRFEANSGRALQRGQTHRKNRHLNAALMPRMRFLTTL